MMFGLSAWEVGGAANAVIAGCYFAISWAIFRGLVQTRQLRSNRLGTATALIFLTCAVHHGSHTVHVLLPLVTTDPAGLAMRHALGWQMDVWDVFGAAVAIVYLSLRSSYGRLLVTPTLFGESATGSHATDDRRGTRGTGGGAVGGARRLLAARSGQRPGDAVPGVAADHRD